MKKIISMLLVITLCFSVLPLPAFAQNSINEYTDDEKEFILMKYTNNEHMLDALFGSDTAIAYWSMVNDSEENGFLKWAIERASKIIGEYPDEQDYAEILANLVMMQSGDIAEQVQNQSQYDDLKDGVDYVMDIVDIASDFVGGAQLLETISPIIDAATGGAEVIIDNVEQAKYYEVSIRDYTQSKLFLEAVANYAENKELQKAASSLVTANDKLLECRLKYLTDSTATLADYEAGFFVENMSFALLKTADLYQTDETVKWYVDCGEKLSDSIGAIFSAGSFAFNMTMLAGDIGFGTSDTFNRYQEMKIVSDVAGAIVEANSQIITPKNAEEDSALTDIQTKCNYYKMLISTHARGEYLVYQLLVSDAGLLSDFRVLFDYFKEPEETTDSWYEGQVECLVEYYDILNNIFNTKKNLNETTLNSSPNLVGCWTIDTQKTNSSNALSLQGAFGTGISYGYEMVLNEDGNASWYIGIGNGGDGTYTIQNTTGEINYLDYETKQENSVALSITQESGKEYILMEYGDYILYWIKKDETAEPVNDKISRRNFYNSDGLLVYYESYAYYDNGLLCSSTLHSVNYMSSGSSYIGTEYTFLYLYDENGNLIDTVLDALTISEWYNENTGEIVLDYEYDATGNSRKVCIYPKTESIEQEKFGVDASKTEEVYGNASIITTDLRSGWATAYLNEIFADEEPTDMTSCRLIYVDSNSIPELWIDYGYGYAGAEVYTQSNDGTDGISISQGGAKWIENENLLLTSGGHMDVYYDEVYKIEDGRFVLLGAGDYGAEDNSNVQYDEQDNPIYDYYWNDSAVSKNEYEQNLNNIFNGTRATNIYQNIYTYDQCKLLLQSLASYAMPSASEKSAGKLEQSIPSDAESFGEHHYKFFTLDSVKTWEDARNYCESLGGHLATITSSEENDFLYQLMVNAGYTSAYFGLTDSYDEGKWLWMDGTEPTFTNWHSGEPNSENSSEDYGMFYWKYTDGTWNDGDFGKRTNKGGTTFICEWNN